MANRYRDLLSILPNGKFYGASGEVLPFVDRSHEFEFSTNKAERVFLVYFNDVASGQVTTDSQGVAIVTTIPGLPPGEYAIKIVDPIDNESRNFYVTIKHIATWLAAYADVLNAMEDDIDEMDLARSLETVTKKYIEPTYGRALRQPRPEGFLIEEYRNYLRQLRQAYRHFGAHPYGLAQAVEGMTSVSPWQVPRAWRPTWRLGQQICPNGYLDQRSRFAEAQFGPAGAIADSPVEELPNLNRQSRVYVHPGFTTSTTTFRQPPYAQRLTVTLADAVARVALTGLNEAGLLITETVPDPSITLASGTYITLNAFSRVTAASKTGGVAASIGLGDSRFIRVRRIGAMNYPGNGVELLYHGQDVNGTRTFSWGNGDSYTLAPTKSSITLRDEGRKAKLIGLREVASSSSTYALDPYGSLFTQRNNRLWLNLDGRGVIGILLPGTNPTATDVVDAINEQLEADPRYGIDYNAVASLLTGNSGNSNVVVMLTAPEAYSSVNAISSRIQLLAGPQDASDIIFGLPNSTTHTVSVINSPYTSISCNSVVHMPSTTVPFNVRIRGARTGSEGCNLYTSGTPTPGSYGRVIVASYAFSAADIGNYVAINASPNNDGLHRIINITNTNQAIIAHEYAHIGEVFSTDSGSCTVWGKGEIVTVTGVNTASNTLTLASPGTTFAWPAGAIVELVNETPVEVNGTDGLGTIDIDVDSSFRPHHDFGDAITADNPCTLTSARGNFTTELTGRTLTISGCLNETNNGSFELTFQNATTVTFTNPNAIDETSNFEWSVDNINTDITRVQDTITPIGALMPDGWQVLGNATILLGNSTAASAPGRLATSRVTLRSASPQSANPIQIQREIPEALAWRGLPLEAQWWFQEHTGSATYNIYVSFDGTTFNPCPPLEDPPSSPFYLFDRIGPQKPSLFPGRFFVPYNAERCVIRLERTSTDSGIGTMSFERFTLSSPFSTGLYQGTNTIPRSQKRSKFGEFLYVWSAEQLTAEEKTYLGLPLDDGSLPAKPGHIDYITNAHGYWDRVDVSEIDTSSALPVKKNMRGVFDSIEWIDLEGALGLTRMEVVVGVPTRLTYARPIRTTKTQFEPLTMIDGGDGPGTARANLAENTNHDGPYPRAPNTGTGTNATLYEVRNTPTTLIDATGLLTFIPAGEPIPVPDSLDDAGVQPWEFTANNQIRVNAPYYNSTASYYLDYEVLMRITTKPFQTSVSGTAPEDYLWFIDFARYVRHQVAESLRPRTQQLTFDVDYTAILDERTAIDEPASIERDNGTIREIVPFSDWSFQDTKTVRISSAVFDPDFIYTITYTAKVPRSESPAKLALEWRYANTQNDLTNDIAEWRSVENGQIISPVPDGSVTVNNVPAWHQLRVTASNIEDVRDFRIYSMGIKGVNLFSDNPNAPGILV